MKLNHLHIAMLENKLVSGIDTLKVLGHQYVDIMANRSVAITDDIVTVKLDELGEQVRQIVAVLEQVSVDSRLLQGKFLEQLRQQDKLHYEV